MTERGFHPFAVLHFLRKTILLYLLPLLQVLFARNWAALRTALVQGAALLAVTPPPTIPARWTPALTQAALLQPFWWAARPSGAVTRSLPG